jgi:amidase
MRLPLLVGLGLLAAAGLAAAQPAGLSPYASAEEQQQAMAQGRTTSEALVRASLARIAAMDHQGPRLNAVIAVSPNALAEARARDAARRNRMLKGPLFGIPVLVKDNIETADGLATTAGSLALAANVTGRDAPLVKGLKAAGAVILGKANLSEWANFRSNRSMSGWSAVGGMVRNPHSLDRSACGSSSGSAAAVAAGYVAAAIGTETDGSITCPAAANGVVGFKPTVGLVSRTHVVPISAEQDTAGPITRTVRDAAAVLSAIAGSDPADPATREADARRADFVAGLDARSLKGARIGVLRGTAPNSPATQAVFERALAALRDAGAVLVEVERPSADVRGRISAAEGAALYAEFKAQIGAYLATTPPAVKARNLDQLIAFNAATPAETALFGQDIFEDAAKSPPLTDAKYIEQRATARRLASEALAKMLADGKVEALVAASGPPVFLIDAVNGDSFGGGTAGIPAIAGAPHLTVPMGQVGGLPVGISFIGPRWSDGRILSLGHAFEQATHAWRAPQFLTSAAGRPEVGRAFDPHGPAATRR